MTKHVKWGNTDDGTDSITFRRQCSNPDSPTLVVHRLVADCCYTFIGLQNVIKGRFSGATARTIQANEDIRVEYGDFIRPLGCQVGMIHLEGRGTHLYGQNRRTPHGGHQAQGDSFHFGF